MRQYSAGMWIYGQIRDRYATDGYGPEISTLDIIARGALSGLIGLDLNYPFPENDLTLKDVQESMTSHGLVTSCVTPAVYGRRFCRGGFTNPDPAIRHAAIDLAHEAVDAAIQLNAKYVKFWPGQDGYDYPFQCNYREYYQLATEGIKSVAQAFPAMKFAIEYKLKEPRNRLFWSGGPTTLLAIERINCENLGIVLDFGHSLFAKENPAEMLYLIHDAGRLVDIELDDNYREWDDDLTPGALHLIETLEFLCAVRDIGWNDPLKLDLFPYREDPVAAVQESISVLRDLEDRCARLDLDALHSAQSGQDALAAMRIARAALLG